MAIQTVLGKVQPQELGHIQPHEHIMLEENYATSTNPALKIDDKYKSIKEVEDFSENGGSAIVDAQPLGAGRMAEELVHISRVTNISIIAATGFHKSMFYWPEHWIHTVAEESFYNLLKKEIYRGMFVGNDIRIPNKQIEAKPGIIKMAVDSKGIVEEYQSRFTAASAVAAESDLPVMVHMEKESDPFQVIDFLLKARVPAKNIILSHLDRTHHDLELHKEIASSGVFLEYDTIGRFKYHSDKQEVNLIREITECGYMHSLLFSLDTTRERMKAYGGDISLNYLLDVFIPLLKEEGFTDDNIRQFTQENPKKVLTIGGKI